MIRCGHYPNTENCCSSDNPSPKGLSLISYWLFEKEAATVKVVASVFSFWIVS